MHDPESGLSYNRKRMLHATIGRFVQRDPLGYVDGMSLYEYVTSHPTGNTDPSGLLTGDGYNDAERRAAELLGPPCVVRPHSSPTLEARTYRVCFRVPPSGQIWRRLHNTLPGASFFKDVVCVERDFEVAVRQRINVDIAGKRRVDGRLKDDTGRILSFDRIVFQRITQDLDQRLQAGWPCRKRYDLRQVCERWCCDGGAYTKVGTFERTRFIGTIEGVIVWNGFGYSCRTDADIHPDIYKRNLCR